MEERDSSGRFVRKSKDISGNRYFRLVAMRQAKTKDKHHAFWECLCDCGNTVVVRKDSLESGSAKSCGCYLKERYVDGHLRKYDHLNKRIYKIWQGMKDRCYNPNSPEYYRYGGRGIIICDEWLNDFLSFQKWSEENGYDKTLSIDRINNDGNYEPSNCRWADDETQNYNKMCTVRVNVYGTLMTLKDISKKYMIPIHTVRMRLKRYRRGTISLEQFLENVDV